MMLQPGASRNDILVPILSPTEATPKPDQQSSSSTTTTTTTTNNLPINHAITTTATHQHHQHHDTPYDAAHEDHITNQIITNPANILSLTTTTRSPAEMEAVRAEAQALIAAKGFNTRKALRAYLDEEIASVSREVGEIARRRQDVLAENALVEQEVRELEGRYNIERRALDRSIKGG